MNNNLSRLRSFFIVGCPRSGTTLLQQALNRHSRVLIPAETAFLNLPVLAGKLQREHLKRINDDLGIGLNPPGCVLPRKRGLREFHARMAWLYVKKENKPRVTHFGEKSIVHLARLPRLRRLFPEAKVLLIFRDGRDVALSLTRVPWASTDLDINFALWLYCYRLQRRAEDLLGRRLLCIRYEDLVTEPEVEFRRILAFLGLPFEPEVICGQGNVLGIPPWEYSWKFRAGERITTERIGLWRDGIPAEKAALLERWGARALQHLGYALVTGGASCRLPWSFFPRVGCKGLLWHCRRPRFGQLPDQLLQSAQPTLEEILP